MNEIKLMKLKKKLNFKEEELAVLLPKIESIFVGEDDFSCSLELFLNIRISQIKSEV
ncbi:hypothetical protein D1872_78740 [compost metagenome]